jgi:SnoaL-like domain
VPCGRRDTWYIFEISDTFTEGRSSSLLRLPLSGARKADTLTTADNAALQRLLDKEAIREVLGKYPRSVNRSDVELMLSLYNDPSWEEHAGYRGSGQGWASLPRDSAGRKAGHHLLGQCVIDLDGDTAFAETYFLMHMQTAFRLSRGGANQPATDGGDWTTIIAGRFLDRLDRVNGDWRITVRKVVADWGQEIPGPDDQRLLKPFLHGEPGMSDPVYSLRTFAVPGDDADRQ